MMNVFAALLAGVLLGANPIAENSDEGFSLLKQSETCLYRPEFPGKPWSQNYSPRPLFARLPTGEIFMIEKDLMTGWGYFFTPGGKLNRMINLIPPSGKGTPGKISGVTTIFVTPRGEFGTYDNARRINLFDPQGNLNSSFLHPCFRGGGIVTAAFDYNTLAFGGFTIDIQDSVRTMYPRFVIVDYENPSEGFLSPSICEYAYTEAEPKGKMVHAFVTENVTALAFGKIACNVGSYPHVYIVSEDGTMIEEDTLPSHFRPLAKADILGFDWPEAEKGGHLTEETERWLTTWTHSYPIYEYSDNRLIVPRVLYPTFYLDLYSYSDEKIEYLGYTSTDKEFLFADSSGVYLLERKDDTSVVVGQYELVTADFHETRESEWTTNRLAAEGATGIRKVPPDTSGRSPDYPKKKEYSTKIDTVKLVSVDGVEYLLIDSLTSGKGHVLVFGAPQDCGISKAIEDAQKYVEENPDFDYTVVYTHPYPEELKEFIRLKRSYCDYPILTNTDKERLENVLRRSLCLLVVSEDGTIVSRVE